MNYFRTSCITLILLINLLGLVYVVSAQSPDPIKVERGDSTEYVTLAPIKEHEKVDTTEPDEWVRSMFFWFISIAGVVGVVKLVYSGTRYMFTESISGKGDYRKDITNVVIGLLIIIASSLILAVINPELLASPFEAIREALKFGTGADASTVPGATTATDVTALGYLKDGC